MDAVAASLPCYYPINYPIIIQLIGVLLKYAWLLKCFHAMLNLGIFLKLYIEKNNQGYRQADHQCVCRSCLQKCDK